MSIHERTDIIAQKTISHYDVDEFVRLVKKHIDDGWQPEHGLRYEDRPEASPGRPERLFSQELVRPAKPIRKVAVDYDVGPEITNLYEGKLGWELHPWHVTVDCDTFRSATKYVRLDDHVVYPITHIAVYTESEQVVTWRTSEHGNIQKLKLVIHDDGSFSVYLYWFDDDVEKLAVRTFMKGFRYTIDRKID